MRKIKEKRMQSYVLRARKMVQEGKNKEGAEMLSEGLNYYSKNIIKALTPYATADAGIISMVLRNLADGIEKDNPGMYAISCGGIESNKQRIGDLTTECDLTSFAGKNIASVIEAWNKYCEETER